MIICITIEVIAGLSSMILFVMGGLLGIAVLVISLKADEFHIEDSDTSEAKLPRQYCLGVLLVSINGP